MSALAVAIGCEDPELQGDVVTETEDGGAPRLQTGMGFIIFGVCYWFAILVPECHILCSAVCSLG